MAQAPAAIVKIPTKIPQLVPDRTAKPPVGGPSARAKKASGRNRSPVFASGNGRAPPGSSAAGAGALEAIAQVVGAPLDAAGRPDEGPSSPGYWQASYRNLLSVLDEWPAVDDAASAAAGRARAVTRFAEHVHAYGRELEAAGVLEISEILGTRQPDLATAEAALEELVLTASADRDAELVRYFHRWTQRQQFLIEGTGAHHEKLIHISPQPLTGWA